MKKSIFIITLVFTLLLSCSGGGLVAYAADDLYSELEPQFDEKLVDQYGGNLEEYCYYVDFTFSDTYYLTKYCRFYSTEPILLSMAFERYSDSYYFTNTTSVSMNEGENIICVQYYDYIDGYDKEDKWMSNGSCFYLNTASLETALSYIIFSNHDIYDESGNLVFQKPSDPLGIPRETLEQILTQENPLKEVLILLPMAMVCLVGYVALRKALRTLETILKTA